MAHEVEPESFAAASTTVLDPPDPNLEQQQQGNIQTGGDVGRTAADVAAKETAEKAASEKAAADKAAAEKVKADDASNPNLDGGEVKKPVVEEEDKKPDGMTDKAFVSWKAIKADAKTARQEATEANARAKEFESKLAEAMKSAPDLEALKKELAAAKQQLAENEGEIYISRVESHPKYKTEVKAPMDEITTGIIDIAKRYEVPPETLLRAIQEPDKAKRADLLEGETKDFKAVDREEVVQSARDWQRLQKKADEMRADSKGQFDQLTRAQQAEQEREQTKTRQDYNRSAQEAWDAALLANPYVKKVEGKDGWNKTLDGWGREIQSVDILNLPVEEVAKMKVAHKLLPEVQKIAVHFESEMKKEKELRIAAEAKIAAYLKTAPKSGGGNGSTTNGASAEGDEGFVSSVRPALQSR